LKQVNTQVGSEKSTIMGAPAIYSSSIFATGIEFRYGGLSAFTPCLPTLIGLMSRASWTGEDSTFRRLHQKVGRAYYTLALITITKFQDN